MKAANIERAVLAKTQVIKLGLSSSLTLGRHGHYTESTSRPETGLWGKRASCLSLGTASKVTLGGAGFGHEGGHQRPGWRMK